MDRWIAPWQRGGSRLKRIKKVVAGRLVTCVSYSVPRVQDQPRQRAARQRISSAAQARLNVVSSRNTLERLLACNYDKGDLWITLTYDNEHLPDDRKSANLFLQKKFLQRLRGVRRRRGDDLKYIYATQQVLGDGTLRLHHHLVVNFTGPQDYDDIRSLWTGGANIDISRIRDDDHISDLATYMCHEPLEHGKPKPGERTWQASRNISRPVEETFDVPEDVTVQAPVGAFVVETDSCQNEYGDYAYLKYWLPRAETSGLGNLPLGEVLINGRTR